MYENPQLEIYINSKNYTAKSTIEGSLCINNFKNIVVKSLKLFLYGEIKVDVDVHNMILFNETNNIFDFTLYYDFINNKFLNKNINNNFLLKSCHKNIDIKVPIPDLDLPSTYYYKRTKIIYKLMFILKYIKSINNNNIIYDIVHEEKEINIIPFIYTFNDKYFVPIISNNYMKIINKHIYGMIYYSFLVPNKAYIPGDKIQLELNIGNLININSYILIVKIRLKKQLVFIKFFDYIESNETIFNYSKKIIYNRYNDTIIKFDDLQIPYNCNYSIFPESTNNIFELKYILKINMFILKHEKCIPLKESNIPIIIGSYRFDHKKIYNLPFIPKYEIT